MKHLAITLLLGALCGPNVLAQTETDAANLLFLKQEEKLARDVYQVLGAQWGHATFLNIAQSEQRHMNALDRLIAAFGLTDKTPEAPGEFTIDELQDLYNQLTDAGGRSLKEALEAGVVIEVADIADIEEMLAATQDPMVRRVLTNLRNGSYRHLAAFTRALEQPDGSTCIGGRGGNGRRGGRGGQVGDCGERGGKGGRRFQGGGRNAAAGNGGACLLPEATTPQRRRVGR